METMPSCAGDGRGGSGGVLAEQPAVAGDTATARTANRRIEILIEPIVTGTAVAMLRP